MAQAAKLANFLLQSWSSHCIFFVCSFCIYECTSKSHECLFYALIST